MNQDINNQNNINQNQVSNNTPFTPINAININNPQGDTNQVNNQMNIEQNVNNNTVPNMSNNISPSQNIVEQNNSALSFMNTEASSQVPQNNNVAPVPQTENTNTFNQQPPIISNEQQNNNNQIQNLINQNTQVETEFTPLPNQSVNQISNTNPEPVKEKKKMPVLVIVAIIFVIFAVVYYIFIFPKLMNGGNSNTSNNETQNEETNNNVVTEETNWQKYSNLRTGELGTTKDLFGGYRILSSTETYWVFRDNEFYQYQSVNNLEDNYWQGTMTVSIGKEEAVAKGIDGSRIDKIINESNGTITENNIYTLTLTPTKIIQGGIDVSETNITDGLIWDYIWIIIDHNEEGIEAQVINLNDDSTSNYVKIND